MFRRSSRELAAAQAEVKRLGSELTTEARVRKDVGDELARLRAKYDTLGASHKQVEAELSRSRNREDDVKVALNEATAQVSALQSAPVVEREVVPDDVRGYVQGLEAHALKLEAGLARAAKNGIGRADERVLAAFKRFKAEQPFGHKVG